MRICILAIVISTLCLAGCGTSHHSQGADPIMSGSYTAHFHNDINISSAAVVVDGTKDAAVTLTALGGGQYALTLQASDGSPAITATIAESDIVTTAGHTFFLGWGNDGAVRLDVDNISYRLTQSG